MSLQAMQSSSAAGSFLDEVVKWQKRLQTIEGVLTLWLRVQEKWLQLEEVHTRRHSGITGSGNTLCIALILHIH